jgi:hypothetical protein
MSDVTGIEQFYGDGLRRFVLTPALVMELERRTGSAIGLLMKRVVASEFHVVEIMETIRLGLIGGGEAPETADALMRAYAHPRPLVESYLLAVNILDALMVGEAPEVQQEQSGEE